jgi:hypothetical protein
MAWVEGMEITDPLDYIRREISNLKFWLRRTDGNIDDSQRELLDALKSKADTELKIEKLNAFLVKNGSVAEPGLSHQP